MMENKTDMELKAFFDAAKNTEPLPDAAFLQAVMADAVLQTEARTKATRVAVPTPFYAGLLRNIGGWQPVAAMTACTFFGIYIGYSTPDSLNYINNTQQNAETFDDGSFSVASEIEALFQEG
ncbi:MAG: hypothetical protein JKX71_11860 [Amylibacter sp.]|nr:hypothetical protein [Amylibacter sp.]